MRGVSALSDPSLALASPALRLAALAVLVLAVVLPFVWLRRRRAAMLAELGQQSAPPSPAQIDAAWLERHVFSLTPELVGAVYDRRIAWPEVAALVARMSGEAKLASRVAGGAQGWGNLELWLLVDRQELSGYERELVESLFFAERTTSGDAVQEAYRSVGFDPAAILRRHLKASCDDLLGARPVFTWSLRLALGACALGLLVAIVLGTSAVPVCLAALLAALGPLSASRIAARWRRDPLREDAATGAFAAGAGASAVALGALIALWPALGPLEVVIFAGWSLVGSALTARVVASRENARGLALRRNLLAARQFFASELERLEPRLQDDWLPYLIALDLKGAVDHWYLAFGRLETAARQERLEELRASREATNATPEQAWTGGAGGYGGVGAAGAWIAATLGLTVAAPGRRRLPAELGYL
jgi:hypothetical protein